jgi:2-oxoglutarate ferredoxin oxidoreductase subunit alpha
MTHVRAEKIERIANDVPLQQIEEGADSGKLLVLGWGSTYGAIREAVRRSRARGLDVSHAHLRYMNPMPKNLAEVLSRFDRVLIPELNMGQLATVIKSRFLLPAVSYPKVQGQPFRIAEIETKIRQLMES